jgi:hypothetical protein
MHRALVFLFSTLLFAYPLSAQRNAIPLVDQPLIPVSVAPGAGGFTLTVNGTGFVSGAAVLWNGSARATTFISSTTLTAAILASDVASASTARITVVNPAPGGGASNVVYFPIASAPTVVALTSTVYMTDPSENLSTSGLIATADVNNDGNIDIVENLFSNPIPPGGGIITFLGNGDGTFQAPVLSDSSCDDGALAVGDFNNDGLPDVAAIGLVGAKVCIMLGNGKGAFQPGTPLTIGSGTVLGVSPVVADFNGDGNLDLALAQGNGNNKISVLLGNGDGTMQPVVQYASGFRYPETSALGVADFNRDGKLDLVVGGDGLAILLGNGDGTFQRAVSIPTVEFDAPSTIAIADFNGDGKLDLAVSDGQSTILAVFLGNGDGTFQPQVTYPLSPGAYCSVVADLNNDGKLDLGCTGGDPNNRTSYAAAIFIGNGDGTFEPQIDFLGEFYPAFSTGAGDFNNDGRIDLAIGQYGGASLQGVYSSVGVYLQTSVQAEPGSLLFPVQPMGMSGPAQSVVVTNEGKSVLDINSISFIGTNAADFSQTNTCGASLGVGEQCTISVTMTPSVSIEEASVVIADNAEASPQSIPLQGYGSDYFLAPLNINFGAVVGGQSSQPQIVTLRNVGPNGTIASGKIDFKGPDAGDFLQTNNCPHRLLGGRSCQVTVTFKPTATGVRKATLEVGQAPFVVLVEGKGR